MFLNNLAISWRLLGNSGDYLAVGTSGQRGDNAAVRPQKTHERCSKDAKGATKAPQRRQTGDEEAPEGGGANDQ